MASATGVVKRTERSPVFDLGHRFLCLAPSQRRTPDMATRRTAPRERAPKRDEDEARFEAWLKDFDTRQADLTARLDAILHSLGVDPAKVHEPA